MTEIRLEHVSYAYDNEKILEDINLQVVSGEVVSILGPSGVGKTTLFNLIAGILEVQSGRIILDENIRSFFWMFHGILVAFFDSLDDFTSFFFVVF